MKLIIGVARMQNFELLKAASVSMRLIHLFSTEMETTARKRMFDVAEPSSVWLSKKLLSM